MNQSLELCLNIIKSYRRNSLGVRNSIWIIISFLGRQVRWNSLILLDILHRQVSYFLLFLSWAAFSRYFHFNLRQYFFNRGIWIRNQFLRLRLIDLSFLLFKAFLLLLLNLPLNLACFGVLFSETLFLGRRAQDASSYAWLFVIRNDPRLRLALVVACAVWRRVSERIRTVFGELLLGRLFVYAGGALLDSGVDWVRVF